MNADQREYLALLAWFYLQHGEPEKALILLRAGARLAPDDRQILKSLAFAELAAGDAGGALASVERYQRAGGEAGPGSLETDLALRDSWRRLHPGHADESEPCHTHRLKPVR
jgi:hypothetical protein